MKYLVNRLDFVKKRSNLFIEVSLVILSIAYLYVIRSFVEPISFSSIGLVVFLSYMLFCISKNEKYVYPWLWSVIFLTNPFFLKLLIESVNPLQLVVAGIFLYTKKWKLSLAAFIGVIIVFLPVIIKYQWFSQVTHEVSKETLRLISDNGVSSILLTRLLFNKLWMFVAHFFEMTLSYFDSHALFWRSEIKNIKITGAGFLYIFQLPLFIYGIFSQNKKLEYMDKKIALITICALLASTTQTLKVHSVLGMFFIFFLTYYVIKALNNIALRYTNIAILIISAHIVSSIWLLMKIS